MRTMATTAVVAGTATAVSGRVSRRQAGKAQQAAEAQASEQAAAPPPPPPAEPAPAAEGFSADAIEQLKSLGALHEQGVLTDEEFAAAKAKLLNP